MAALIQSPASNPIGEINTTPLIDVMLVLLVMFVLSVPVASNVTEFDLPTDGGTPPRQVLERNQVTIGPDGAASWNGQAVSDGELAATLAAAERRVPEPLVLFEPDGRAPYGRSAQILRIVKQSGLSAFAFVGNERFGDFGKASARR